MNSYLRSFLSAGFTGLLMWLGTITLLAQEKTISGVVTDAENGETLIGVNVTAATDRSLGTITDLDGYYRVTVPDTVMALSFSFVGYATQTIEITSNTINVRLSPGQELMEVVVVGYGTQRTREVTSAVTSVKSEDFNEGNISDPIQLIQGKVAGLSIAKPGGDPNADFSIRLRGLSTFGSNTEPLIVIDGVQGASLNSIDPQDIASMDVLKDASAAAIYGTRAASGVILITTKKGEMAKDGRLSNIEFSTSFTVESVARKLAVLSAEDYLTMPNATDFEDNTDWMDAITRDGVSQVYNLSFNGASNNSSYRVAFNYRKGNGIVLNTGYEQLNGRLNFMQKALNDKLTLNLNLSATLRDETYGALEALTFAARYNPTAPITAEDDFSTEWGGYFQREAFYFFNLVAILEQNTLDGQKNEILGSLKADFEPIPGLVFSGFYSQNWRNQLYGQYWSKDSYWTPYAIGSHLGFARKETMDNFHQLFEFTGTYDRSIDKFNFKILGGYSWQENVFENFWAFGKGFLTDGFSYHNLGSASGELSNQEAMSSYKSSNTLIGFFARVSANWNDALFMTANFRRDGSSMFGENNKWGNFPGVSAGADIRRFVDIPLVNRLKIRGSYGITGNLPPEPYLSQLLFNITNESFFYNGQYIQAYAPVRVENPDLKWELKKEWGIGLDFALWSYRVSGSIDYYNSLSTDLMFYAQVPVPPYPTDRMWLNLGEMRNSGIEFAVNVLAVQKADFKYSTDLNLTKYFPTQLVRITNEISSATSLLELGWLGAPFLTGVRTIIVSESNLLPEYINVIDSTYYINDPNYIGQIVAPIYIGIDSLGRLIYEDVDGDGVFNAQKDVRVVGNGLPKFQIGWGNTFTYKGAFLNFFIRGVFGHSLVNVNNARYGVPVVMGVQSGMEQALDFIDAVNGPVFSDVHVEKADYVKLDNFALGYNFNFQDSKYISGLKIYIAGQNLFTITNYSGVEPEVRYGDSYDNNNPLAPGLDRENTYFRTRSLTVGINLMF
ncbi:MAG: SusC/RagA family TonB-linked outer membrane protein [Bacteroidales bacterium]